MGSIAIKFLMKNWQLILIGLLVAGIYFYHANRSAKIESLQAEVVKLNKDLVIAEGNFQACQGKLSQQNEEIKFWVNKGREQRDAIKELEGILSKTKQKYDQEAKRILGENVPKSCQGAMDYLLKGREDLKW